MEHDTTRHHRATLLNGATWCVVIVLALIGVTAAIARTAYPGDLGARMEPFRQQTLAALGRTDPLVHQRGHELARFDVRFAAHPVATLLHIVPGGIFLVLGMLQFSRAVRRRHIRFHRWSGRVLLIAGCTSALAGLYFGLLMPYAGAAESVPIALFGGVFLTALTIAFLAIRRRRVEVHREWMIRAFAVAIAISTVRLVSLIVDIVLAPTGVSPRVVFVISIWTGWVITLGAAELWIARTRPRAQRAPSLRASMSSIASPSGSSIIAARESPNA